MIFSFTDEFDFLAYRFIGSTSHKRKIVRVRTHLIPSQPEFDDGRKDDHSEKDLRASVVAHCDVSPVLELGKGVFYPVPRLVQFLVVFDFRLSVAAPWNAWLDVPPLETVADLVGVVTAIADEMLDPPISHVGQHLVADVVADISSSQVIGVVNSPVPDSSSIHTG